MYIIFLTLLHCYSIHVIRVDRDKRQWIVRFYPFHFKNSGLQMKQCKDNLISTYTHSMYVSSYLYIPKYRYVTYI